MSKRSEDKLETMVAKRYFVSGRVQGVGFRYFVEHAASNLGIRGYARNLDDGRVEVYATGSKAAVDQLAGLLHKGPRFADVRGVEEQDAALQDYSSFFTR